MFLRIFPTLVVMLMWAGGVIAQPSVSTELHMVGDKTIELRVTDYGAGHVYVALHQNEATSVAAAKAVLIDQGGVLIELIHGGSRRVHFTLGGVAYDFDPNRIFSASGIRATLGAQHSADVERAVNDLAQTIVRSLPRSSLIVALHNNTDGRYSAVSYTLGGSYAADASAVTIRDGQDTDNFYFTTDSRWYTLLSNTPYNVVLQSPSARDDGSLSVYAASANVPYVNVEAEHGATNAQISMLRSLLSSLN